MRSRQATAICQPGRCEVFFPHNTHKEENMHAFLLRLSKSDVTSTTARAPGPCTLATEYVRWRKVVEDNNIKMEQ